MKPGSFRFATVAALLHFALFALCAGGTASAGTQAAIVVFEPGLSALEARQRLETVLSAHGFVDQGIDEAMLAHLRDHPELGGAAECVAVMSRYSGPRGRLSLSIDDHTKRNVFGGYGCGGDRRSAPFLRIRIVEARPDGFNEAGQRAFRDLLAALRKVAGADRVVVETPAPRTDEVARWTSRAAASLSVVLLWLAAFAAPTAVIGPPISALIEQTSLSSPAKDAIFALINALVATPVLAPATIVSSPAPNILLLLFGGPSRELLSLYAHQLGWIAPSFAAAFLLSMASRRFIRRARARRRSA